MAQNGGSSLIQFAAFGEQLFTGATARPTLRLGTFTFDQGRDGTPLNAELTVAAVPEPTTWTLLIAGFGLAGAGLRRRVRVAAAA